MAWEGSDVYRDEDGALYGDGRPESVLLAQLEPLVVSMARRMRPRLGWFTSDELAQAGRIGAWRAVRSWQPYRTGVTLERWASVFVRRAMVDEAREQRGRFLDRVHPGELLRTLEAPEGVEATVAAVETLGRVRRLDRRRAFALVAEAAGLSQAEIGEQLGVSASRARWFGLEARRALRRTPPV